MSEGTRSGWCLNINCFVVTRSPYTPMALVAPLGALILAARASCRRSSQCGGGAGAGAAEDEDDVADRDELWEVQCQ